MAGITPINGAGSGGSALEILDEGVTETTACTSIDFVGGGVSVTHTLGATTVNISGGGIADTDGVAEGTTNLYFTEARTLATDLAGLSLASGTDITAADTVLTAAGKLQKHLTDTDTTVAGKQATSAKDASGGYAGLTVYKLNLKDTTNTYTSFFTNSNTAARTYTLPDATGTVALTSDITGTNSGTNTGDQNLFSTIAVSGQSNVVADSTSDTLTLVAGSNVTITTSAGGDSITIAASGGGGSLEVLDEGVSKTSAATSMNFVGAGVAATNVGDAITVTISGAGIADTDALSEGTTNLYFTEARVLGTDLAGLSLASGTDITSASTVLSALGQLQKHLTDTDTTVSGKQASSAKNASGGYVGLTTYDINFKDTSGTYTSLFTNANSAARTYTFPNATGTIALTSDITGTNSNTNTGDQNVFSTIAVSGQSNVVADSTSDTLTLVAGSNITITTSAGGDSITIDAASGGAVPILDETVLVTATPASIDFAGAGVTATQTANAVTVTVPGFTEAEVLATDLAGLSLASGSAITSSSTVLSALGQLQKHLTDTDTTVSGKQVTSEKDATGGYAGLTLYKINFKNAANTFTSFFTNTNTAARTYTFPDYDATVSTVTGTETLTSKTLTAPDINAGTVDNITSFGIRSTGAAFDFKQAMTEAISADRTLTWNVGNASRAITLGGDVNYANSFTTSGAFAQTITATATSNFTLPAGTQTGAATTLAQTFTAGQRCAVTTLTDASTVDVDLALANNFKVVLAGNRTLGTPTNIVAGQSFRINVRQDSTGSRTLAYAWPYIWPAGSAGVLSTAGCTLDKIVGDVSVYATATFTVTIASPGLITWTGHGINTGQRIQMTTTGALPTGYTASTTYFWINNDANSGWLATTLVNAAAGTKINTSGSQSGTHTIVAASIELALNKAYA